MNKEAALQLKTFQETSKLEKLKLIEVSDREKVEIIEEGKKEKMKIIREGEERIKQIQVESELLKKDNKIASLEDRLNTEKALEEVKSKFRLEQEEMKRIQREEFTKMLNSVKADLQVSKDRSYNLDV